MKKFLCTGLAIMAVAFVSVRASKNDAPQYAGVDDDEVEYVIEEIAEVEEAFGDSIAEYTVPPEVQYFLDRGQDYPLNAEFGDDYQAMCDSASKVLSLFPDDVYARNMRSFALYKLDDLKGSVDDALKILCAAYDNSEAMEIAYYAAGVNPELLQAAALPYVSEYLAAPDPQKGDECIKEYLSLLSSSQRSADNISEAIKLAKMASDIKTDDDHVSDMSLAVLYLLSGNSQEALDLIDSCIDDPDYIRYNILNLKELALRNLGRSEEAYKIYEKELGDELTDEYRRILLKDYGAMLAANGRYEESINKFDTAIKNKQAELAETASPDLDRDYAEVILRRGISYILAGNAEKGREDLQKALDYSLESQAYTGLEATAHAWLGNKEEALKWLQMYGIGNDVNTAAIHALIGDNDAALEIVAKLFDSHASSPELLEYDLNFLKLRQTPEYQALVAAYRPLVINQD